MDTDIGTTEMAHLREAIRDSGVPLPELAQLAGVKLRWLQVWMTGGFDEPSYVKIRRLQRTVKRVVRRRPAAIAA